MLKELKSILQKHSNSPDGENIMQEEIEQIKHDIDFLYDLLQPNTDMMPLDCPDYGVTMEITEEIYNELIKYSENKEHLFMGIS